MKENTQNEQVINLDEEQLQAVTGGVQFVRTNSGSSHGTGGIDHHMEQAQIWYKNAGREYDNGNHDLGDRYKNKANFHLERANDLTSGSHTPSTPGSPSSPRSPK